MIATRTRRHSSAIRAIVAALAFMASSAVVARAQSPVDSAAGRKQGQPSRNDRLAAAGGLELTPEQKTKIAAITTRHADEGKAVGELFQTDPDAAMKRMVLLRTKMQAEVRAVLTTEQRAIFDRNVAEMNALMDARLPNAPR